MPSVLCRSVTWAILLILAAPTLLRADENVLSPAEKKSGWKLLFDGKTTAGWRNYRKPGISDGWVVREGALSREGAGGDIVTADQYDSFELLLEYNISPGGNSGVMFHVTEDEDTPWKTGPEIQVQDNVAGTDPQKSGWLYQLYDAAPVPFSGAKVDATRPPGQWNQLRIKISPPQCEIEMNGVKYSAFQIGSADWNARVAKSKFAAFPNFGKPTTGHICLQDHGNVVSYRNVKIRPLDAQGNTPDPIDSTLPLKVEPAFAKVKWEGYVPDDNGVAQSFRPIVVTHAGDGSNRVFVADQQGIIYVLPNDQNAEQGTKFLDLHSKVTYKDAENEEGILGMAFHPRYKENGQFFLYYTASRLEPHTHIISRFRVSTDPNKADPTFEEEILRFPAKKYWNHNGGTIAFGPDGMFYVATGDGGAAYDPFENGQNLGTLFGKVLRIDVDHKDSGKNYAIPHDNPFVGRDKVLGESWAYGFRNIWRMAFDRKTGRLWAADVGQDLWEEVNLVIRGGNYGWSLREGDHFFGNKTSKETPTPVLIPPAFEYDHFAGKSITGGVVYRGTRLGNLIGKYLYADYVTGKIWALDFDEATGKVTGNHAIPTEKMPIITFGEDEPGDVYFTIVTRTGRGIFRFAPAP